VGRSVENTLIVLLLERLRYVLLMQARTWTCDGASIKIISVAMVVVAIQSVAEWR
jgi:hypothetical protein